MVLKLGHRLELGLYGFGGYNQVSWRGYVSKVRLQVKTNEATLSRYIVVVSLLQPLLYFVFNYYQLFF